MMNRSTCDEFTKRNGSHAGGPEEKLVQTNACGLREWRAARARFAQTAIPLAVTVENFNAHDSLAPFSGVFTGHRRR